MGNWVMTFYTWMKSEYANANTPEGDLVRDMFEDNNKDVFKTRTCARMQRYLVEERRASDACMYVFFKCWGEYERYKCEHGYYYNGK